MNSGARPITSRAVGRGAKSARQSAGVNAKVRDLMAPVLGAQKTEALVDQINTLETLDDIRKLRPLLIA